MNHKVFLIKQALAIPPTAERLLPLLGMMGGAGALAGGTYAGATSEGELKDKLKAILIGAGLGAPLGAGLGAAGFAGLGGLGQRLNYLLQYGKLNPKLRDWHPTPLGAVGAATGLGAGTLGGGALGGALGRALTE